MASRRACVVCETNQYAEDYCNIDNQNYLCCSHCGLIYVDELLKTKELYKAYSGNSIKSVRRKLVAPFRKLKHYKNFTLQKQRAEQIINFSINQIKISGDRKNYLDIGCNRGFNLAAAHEQGLNIYGIELVPELIRPFINTYPQYKSQIFSERFEDAKLRLNADMFDLITGIDVLEHFENVVKDLQGIYEVLKPGGIVILQTPDVACERAHKEECQWGALKPLEHLNLFSGANLEILTKRIGFTDYRIEKEFEEADGNFVAVMSK